MYKTIVFGANGYIGRHIVHELQKCGHEVLAIGTTDSSTYEFLDYKCVDITDLNAVVQLDFDVDFIFLFAGKTGTYDGFQKYIEYIGVNELGLLNVLTHLKNTDSKAHLVFPSSRLIFKGQKDVLLLEDSEKEAKTIYAQNKLSCENYLRMYAAIFGVKYTIFRICVVYGNLFDDSFSYGTIGFFLRKAKAKEKITLYGDGSQKRTFTHVSDIVKLISQSLDKPEIVNQSFNIGGNDHLSLKEAARFIAGKYEVDVVHIDWPEIAFKLESGDTMFSDEKLQDIVPYQYKYFISDID